MKTIRSTYTPEGSVIRAELDMAEMPSLRELREALRPIFGDAYTEHVRVLQGEDYRDMFVDENGHSKGLPRNENATAIYRENWLRQHPGTDPEALPFIVGNAVIFDRPVWN